MALLSSGLQAPEQRFEIRCGAYHGREVATNEGEALALKGAPEHACAIGEASEHLRR